MMTKRMAGLTALFLCLAPAAALAHGAALAGTGPGTLALGALWDAVEPYLLAGATAAVSAGLGWLCSRVATWFGISIDQSYQASLVGALGRAIGAGLDRVEAAADKHQPEIKSTIVAGAVNYLIAKFPDAVKALGHDPASLAELVRAELNRLLDPHLGGAGIKPAATSG